MDGRMETYRCSKVKGMVSETVEVSIISLDVEEFRGCQMIEMKVNNGLNSGVEVGSVPYTCMN